MASSIHCINNAADRRLGEYWEELFGFMATSYGRTFSRHQFRRQNAAVVEGLIGKAYLLPDITVWSAPGEHHEIKHKAPTSFNTFGLERYRLQSLVWFANETQQPVFYTIHNHALNGGRDNLNNDIEHWITQNVLVLHQHVDKESIGPSYVNGQKEHVSICYWQATRFISLEKLWLSQIREQRRKAK